MPCILEDLQGLPVGIMEGNALFQMAAGGAEIPEIDSNEPQSEMRFHEVFGIAVHEFILESLQGDLIELELELEGAIGQAAPLAQQGNRLIHHRDKVPLVFSLPVARPTCSWASSS